MDINFLSIYYNESDWQLGQSTPAGAARVAASTNSNS